MFTYSNWCAFFLNKAHLEQLHTAMHSIPTLAAGALQAKIGVGNQPGYKMDDPEGVGVELKSPYGSSSDLQQYTAVLQMIQDHWLGSFLLNVLCYAIIVVPAAFLIRRWKRDPQIKAGVCCMFIP